MNLPSNKHVNIKGGCIYKELFVHALACSYDLKKCDQCALAGAAGVSTCYNPTL